MYQPFPIPAAGDKIAQIMRCTGIVGFHRECLFEPNVSTSSGWFSNPAIEPFHLSLSCFRYHYPKPCETTLWPYRCILVQLLFLPAIIGCISRRA